MMVGHEEVLADGIHGGRVRHAQGGRGVDHAVEAARQPVAVGIAQGDPAFLDQAPVLRMAEAAREDAHLGGAQVAQDALEDDRAAERVGVAHPLREDVGPAATDGGAEAAQPGEGAQGQGQDGQVRAGEALPQDGTEARDHRRRARRPARAHGDRPDALHGRAASSAPKSPARTTSPCIRTRGRDRPTKRSASRAWRGEAGACAARASAARV